MPEPYWEVMKYKEVAEAGVPFAGLAVSVAGSAASGIAAPILTALTNITLEDFKAHLADYMEAERYLGKSLAAESITKVPDIIESILDFRYKTMLVFLQTGYAQGAGGVHSTIYETLTGTSMLLSTYKGLTQRVAINPRITRWANAEYRPNIPDASTAWLMARLGDLTDVEFKAYVAENGWDDKFLVGLANVFTSPAPIGVLLDIRRRGLISEADLVYELTRSKLEVDVIDGITNLVVQYPEPYRLAEMHTKGLTTNDEYFSATRIFGLEDKWAAYWAEGQLRYPDFMTAMALLRRGEIDESTFYFWMQRSQISPAETEVILKLKDVIPPITDAIRFAVREAYLDHDPEKQYGEMVRQAGLMGLSPQAAEWYWYSHWERIPVNLMYANYHRGLWDIKKLEHMLKIVDVHPDDRQDIINVAYGVPSIREMGYGFDVGVYTTEDIKRFRRWGGLSPDDADKAAASMVAYRTEAERNSVRTELMYAFGFERIDEDTLRARLTEIKTPVEALELWVTRAKLYHERIKKPAMDVEGRIVSSSEALTAFKLGLRNEEWTRAQLKALDWTQDRIDTAVERAKLEITEKETEKAEVKYRKLTLAQIKQMYTIHLINKEQMTTEYVIIGYSPDDAELLTEIYTREAPTEVKPKPFTSAMAANFYEFMMFDEEDVYDNFLAEDWDEAQAGMLTMLMVLQHEYPLLRIQYENGTITGEDMVKELMKLEMPEINARALVKETYRELQIKRLSHEKDLTKAEIIKGVKNQVLTPSQGVELLQGIGYDENEAWYILAINKVVAAGDPEGYWEMRKVTESYKKAKGEKYLEIPDEAIMLEKQIKQVKAQIDELKKTSGNEDVIAELLLKLNTLELSMKTLVTEKKLG